MPPPPLYVTKPVSSEHVLMLLFSWPMYQIPCIPLLIWSTEKSLASKVGWPKWREAALRHKQTIIPKCLARLPLWATTATSSFDGSQRLSHKNASIKCDEIHDMNEHKPQAQSIKIRFWESRHLPPSLASGQLSLHTAVNSEYRLANAFAWIFTSSVQMSIEVIPAKRVTELVMEKMAAACGAS